MTTPAERRAAAEKVVNARIDQEPISALYDYDEARLKRREYVAIDLQVENAELKARLTKAEELLRRLYIYCGMDKVHNDFEHEIAAFLKEK